MLKRLSIIGHPLRLPDVMRGTSSFFKKRSQEYFQQQLSGILGLKYVFCLSSGIAAFYVILETLKKLSARKEVIVPCYTAPSLVVAIQKAGLTPVVCDIRLTDFNADGVDVLKKINQNTLCILGVHMFGIPWVDIVDLRKKIPKDIFIIEDCAQAFGSRIQERAVGSFGDISFYSFNRGKNLPTYDGGCIVTNSKAIAESVAEAIAGIPSLGAFAGVLLALKVWALYFSFKPSFYSIFYPLIACFKDTSVPDDFRIVRYTSFQAGVGSSLLVHAQETFTARCENGKRLISLLHGIPEIILPKIPENVVAVFNRFPLVFKEARHRDRVMERLHRAGIESSKLYLKPLHHIFDGSTTLTINPERSRRIDLGYKKDDFPNAVYFAQRLLTLPIHPLVEQEDIEVMARIIKEVVSR